MVKIIHYCWFGGNPKTKTIEKCIASWRRFFPNWEIREWNETNFDTNCNVYVQQAYTAKKWAFVSDYCRFWALEHFGGIYFDTDVEVIRSFEPLFTDTAFAGFETDRFVAPGLVLYVSEPGNRIITEAKEYYESAQFLDENGDRIRLNVCGIFTSILEKHGFKPNGQMQICDGMKIYPKDYFCPFDDATGILHKTNNTYAIHWYDKSWMSKSRILRNRITRIAHRVFGVTFLNNVLRSLRIRK